MFKVISKNFCIDLILILKIIPINKPISEPIKPIEIPIVKNILVKLLGLITILMAIIIALIMISYDPTDPSFRSSTGSNINNFLGSFGSRRFAFQSMICLVFWFYFVFMSAL